MLSLGPYKAEFVTSSGRPMFGPIYALMGRQMLERISFAFFMHPQPSLTCDVALPGAIPESPYTSVTPPLGALVALLCPELSSIPLHLFAFDISLLRPSCLRWDHALSGLRGFACSDNLQQYAPINFPSCPKAIPLLCLVWIDSSSASSTSLAVWILARETPCPCYAPHIPYLSMTSCSCPSRPNRSMDDSASYLCVFGVRAISVQVCLRSPPYADGHRDAGIPP